VTNTLLVCAIATLFTIVKSLQHWPLVMVHPWA